MSRKLLPITMLALATLLLAACGDGDGDGGEATTDLQVLGTDSLAYEPDAFTVPAGEEVTVELTSEASVEHDFIIEDAPGGELDVVEAAAGETATGTFTVDEPGTYTVYCSVPGHREAGMEASLEVVEG